MGFGSIAGSDSYYICPPRDSSSKKQYRHHAASSVSHILLYVAANQDTYNPPLPQA